MDKRSLRKEVSARIAAMTDREKARESAAVAEKIARLGLEDKKVFIYNSLSDEVDTSEAIKELAKNNEVYLPVVDGEKMYLARYDGSGRTGAYGITEPTGKRYSAKEISPDVCVTPLRAFDAELNRLGRGKGYYDRFFAECDCEKIAIAFDCQKVDALDTDAHDVKVDAVLTASGTYRK